MSWFKLESNFAEDPKLLAAGDEATLVFVLGLAYCSRNLTDGAVPKAALRRLIDGDAVAAAARLVEVGLWEDDGDQFIITNYLVHQTSSEVGKEKSAKRSSAGHSGNHQKWHVARGIVAPNCDLCSAPSAPAQQEEPELDAAAVRSRVEATCDAVVVDGDAEQTVAGYRHVAQVMIPAAAQRYAEVKGIGEPSLQNVAVAHAARTFLGEEIDPSTFKRLAALRKSYGVQIFDAMPKAAAGATGDPISYLSGILKKETAA